MSWEKLSLKECIDTTKGFAFKSEWFSQDGIPVVKVKDFTADSIDSKDLSCLPTSMADAYTKYTLRTGDVIIQTVGSWPSNPNSVVGKVVRVPKEIDGALLNQNAVKIIPNEKLDSQFLFYLLRVDGFKKYIIGTAQGSASQASITLDAIRGYEFAVPSVFVQQKIAGTLSAYDDLIDNNRKRIALLEKAARLLYEEWFVRLQFPGHEHTPVVDGVPEGWEKVLLPDAVDINPRTKVAADSEKWFVEMSRLSNSSMVISDPVMKEGNSGSKFKNHDTLLARITPCLENGKTGYVNFLKEDESGFGSTEFIVLRGKKVPSQFVYCLARTEHFRGTAITSMVGSSGRQRVQTAALDDYEMLLPNKGLLDIFEATVKPAFEAVRVLSIQTQKLQAARDLLLPRLMSGELAV